MESTFLKRLFGIGNEWEYQSTHYVKGGADIHLSARREAICCPECGANHIALHGTRDRRVRGGPVGLKSVTFVVHVPRCQCRECGEFFDSSPLLPREGAPTPWDLPDLLEDSSEL